VIECPQWHHHFDRLERKLDDITQLLQQVEASLVDMKARIQEDFDELQRQIAAGASTPEIVAAITRINESIQGVNPLPDFPPPPTP